MQDLFTDTARLSALGVGENLAVLGKRCMQDCIQATPRPAPPQDIQQIINAFNEKFKPLVGHGDSQNFESIKDAVVKELVKIANDNRSSRDPEIVNPRVQAPDASLSSRSNPRKQ